MRKGMIIGLIVSIRIGKHISSITSIIISINIPINLQLYVLSGRRAAGPGRRAAGPLSNTKKGPAAGPPDLFPTPKKVRPPGGRTWTPGYIYACIRIIIDYLFVLAVLFVFI